MDEVTKPASSRTPFLAGALDPSPVFDMTVDPAGVPDGYEAMDERKALEVLVKL